MYRLGCNLHGFSSIVRLCVACSTLAFAAFVRSQDAGKKPEHDAVRDSYRLFEEQKVSLGGLQGELQSLVAKRRGLQSEKAYIQAKLDWVGKQIEEAKKQGTAAVIDVDQWVGEAEGWKGKLTTLDAELVRTLSEEEALITALRETAKGSYDKDMVVPGETLQLYIAEDEELNGLYQVRRGGYIIIPRVGRIFVAGKTFAEIESLVKEKLEDDQLRQATVVVERITGWDEVPVDEPAGRGILYLEGQVAQRGPWSIPAGFSPTIVTTLLRIGLTRYADLERVRVLRLVNGRGLVEEINVKQIMDGEGLTSDFNLEPDDIIIIPAKGSGDADSHVVYVIGNVKNPGPRRIEPTEGLTPYTAIIHSGGATRNADLERVELVRLDKRKKQTLQQIVDVEAVMDGIAPDVPLQHNDILIVPGKTEPKRIYFTGSVEEEGIFEMPATEDLTLYTAIVHRGGFARFANLKKAYVLRDMGDGLRTRIPVDLKDVKNGVSPDLILEDNDIVVVPEKFFSF